MLGLANNKLWDKNVTNTLGIILLMIGLFSSSFAVANVCDNPSQACPSNTSFTREHRQKLSAKSGDTPAIYNELEHNGTVKIILSYNTGTNVPTLSRQKNVLKQFKQNQALIQDKILRRHFVTTELGKKIRGANRRLRRFEISPMMAMTVDQNELITLAADPEVTAINYDSRNYTKLQESVPLIGMLAVPDGAYAMGATGTGQAVAIIDTGAQSNHPFLSGKIVAEACFSNGYESSRSLCPNGASKQYGTGAADATTAACMDSSQNLCTHGTHVAGIAAGYNPTAGIFDPPNGVAKESKIVAVQVFTRSNNIIFAYTSDVIAGLEWVYANIDSFPGAKITAVNISLGTEETYSSPCNSEPEKPIIDLLRASGVATIIASGNDSQSNGVTSPACISTAITVGATTKTDHVANYSNESLTLVDLLAPGSSIYSSIPLSTYDYEDGTSMAASHVTGAFSAIRSRLPDATVDAIENALKISGIPLPALSGNFTTPLIQVNDALIVLGVKHDQTITFSSIPSLYYGARELLSAAASSGLPVNYSSLTPRVCTVTNTIVTAIGTGDCIIAANQTGDARYYPAPEVNQAIPVNIGATLALSKTGNGRVSSSPTGIDCGTDCFYGFPKNSAISLSAQPDSDSIFLNWRGACTEKKLTCAITLTKNLAVKANFKAIPIYKLTLKTTGMGSVNSSDSSINCGSNCTASYKADTSITLSATANAGHIFTGWRGGNCLKNSPHCTIKITKKTIVYATFK